MKKTTVDLLFQRSLGFAKGRMSQKRNIYKDNQLGGKREKEKGKGKWKRKRKRRKKKAELE